MRRRTLTSALVVLAVLLPAAGALTSASRLVHREVASPLDAMPDAAHFRIDVPAGHAVRVRADSTNASTFTMTWCDQGTSCSSTLPSMARDLTLQSQLTSDWWTLAIDPTSGAKVDVHVVFDGFLVDLGNEPGDFTLTDQPRDQPCLGGACLP